jgi:hypothetical protein
MDPKSMAATRWDFAAQHWNLPRARPGRIGAAIEAGVPRVDPWGGRQNHGSGRRRSRQPKAPGLLLAPVGPEAVDFAWGHCGPDVVGRSGERPPPDLRGALPKPTHRRQPEAAAVGRGPCRTTGGHGFEDVRRFPRHTPFDRRRGGTGI